MSQLGCVDSGNKLQRQKKGPRRQIQRISLGQAAPACCNQGVASPWEPLELRRKQKYTPEDRRCGEGTGVLRREQACSFTYHSRTDSFCESLPYTTVF